MVLKWQLLEYSFYQLKKPVIDKLSAPNIPLYNGRIYVGYE